MTLASVTSVLKAFQLLHPIGGVLAAPRLFTVHCPVGVSGSAGAAIAAEEKARAAERIEALMTRRRLSEFK